MFDHTSLAGFLFSSTELTLDYVGPDHYYHLSNWKMTYYDIFDISYTMKLDIQSKLTCYLSVQYAAAKVTLLGLSVKHLLQLDGHIK